ncbi:MAG: 30S ribosomal protein S13 [Candidatus Azosocius agrarius]|nr:MAG: 30S ribosomal protein S13 [Gammaproteobacteria bacterium]
MVRVAGVVLPSKKHIIIALTDIYGIGYTRAKYICNKVGVSELIKVSDLKDDEIVNIQNIVNEFEVEGDLRRRISINIKRLKDIKCYRGMRHRLSLPVRGQRTKTNAKTRKKKKSKLTKKVMEK